MAAPSTTGGRPQSMTSTSAGAEIEDNDNNNNNNNKLDNKDQARHQQHHQHNQHQPQPRHQPQHRRPLEREQYGQSSRINHDVDDYLEQEAAHVDANRLLAELQAAISGSRSGNMEDLQDADLPPLPNDDEDEDSFLRSDASFLGRSDMEEEEEEEEEEKEGGAGHGGHNSTFDERELRRHLMDVESSFLPDVIVQPAIEEHTQEHRGADDTYVNLRSPSPEDQPTVSALLGLPQDASAGRTPGVSLRAKDQQQSHESEQEEEDYDDDDDDDERHRSREYGQDSGDDSSTYRQSQNGQGVTGTLDNSGEQSTSDVQPSSPAAAAAERTQYRVNEPSPSPSPPPSRYREDEDYRTYSSSRNRSSTPPPSRGQHRSPFPEDIVLPPSDVGSGSLLTLNSVHSLSPNRLAKRPSYFSNRQASTRSYAESVLSPGDFNADYALQTGGAIPSDIDNSRQSHHSARSGFGLSRLPSFGSIASAVSRDSNDDKPVFNRGVSGTSVLAGLRAERQLGRLDEEDRASVLSDPVTPRPPNRSTFAAPTDTIITQHVQNIHVPDTIARDFHQRNGDMSPDKRPQSSANNMSTFQTRPRSGNLTLKEQNSKIDKLTKENFDLKLKIHFLDQALQNRSDEGVKDMINKNVQFQTDLANERKESQSLRRRIREMERRLKEQAEELDEARKSGEDDDPAPREDMEYEIMTLSEEVDRLTVKITRLSADNMAKEIEKRKMAEYISALNDRKGNEQSAAEEESEMWKDLLTTETTRREQAEDDVRKLREELVLLRSEKAAETNAKSFGIHRLRRQKNFASRSASRASDESADHSAADRSAANTASSVTLVEQLRHENAELRRDLGAQTSMLTSRNKERERLQQEIEDLKLLQRKSDGGRSIAGDSILDRSISRQHQRAQSRTSGHTAATLMSDTERDEWERRDGQLRDQNAALRMNYQELEREVLSRDAYIGELENAVENLESTYDSAVNDLQALQKERDEALQYLEEREREALRLREEYEKLKDEAVTAINELEGDLDVKEEEAKRFASDLKDRNDDFQALQRELRDLSNSLMQLEDDRAAALKRIESLEQELDEATQELDEQDKKLRESITKNERFEVQHESLQAEIAFLREEQEGDKVRIGDLENNLSNAQQSINDEREKMQELEDSLIEERRQREILDNQSKQEVQKVLNDLNVETSNAKDEARRLRRALSSKEVEASAYKRNLDELESGLRNALGDMKGKRTTWIKEIERIQNDLESTMDELEKTKSILGDRDRLLRNRDMLLESSGLESRRLSDLLDKERDARKRDLHQFEQMQRGHSVNNRTMAQHESRMLELESARSSDRRKMALLEQQYRDQLIDRNNLLLALWNRLSTLCGVEWAQNHALVNGELPSLDVISRSFPSFNKNVIEAVRTIEGILGTFKQRIKGVEKTLMKDYQTLTNNLDGRMKRMDFLERAVKDAQTQIDEQAREQAHLRKEQSSSRSTAKSNEELLKLKQEVKVLKTELKFYKQHPPSFHQQQQPTSQPTSQPQQKHQHRGSDASDNESRRSTASMLTPKAIANTLMRHHSSTAIEQIQQQNGSSSSRKASGIVIATPPIQPSEQRWIHRLKELERRLKAEREARLLDRRGARQRLEERSAENEELRLMLEREKDRRGSEVEAGLAAGEESGGDRSVD